MTQWLDAPATSPDTAAALAGLDALLGATARGDQAGFDAAVEARRDVVVASFGASIELRRNEDGLLDAPASSIARLAAANGMDLPAADSYLATELLEAVPWPGATG